MSRTVSLLVLSAALLTAACATTPPPERTGEDGLVWNARAIPTGSASTSAVLLERGTQAQIPVAQAHEYKIRVTNLTDLPLDDVVVTEQGSTDLAIGSADPAPAVTEPGRMSWALGRLDARETRIITVTATPQKPGSIESRCEVMYRAALLGSTTVYEPKLAIDRVSPTASLVGEPFEYQIEVRNPGTGPAKDVFIKGKLPEGVETLEGLDEYRFNVGELDAGAKRVYVVQVRGKNEGDFVLRTAVQGAGDLNAETQPVALAVRRPLLAVEVKGPDKWVLDRTATYKIRVINKGEGGVKDAVLVFDLPEGLLFESASRGPTSGPKTVTWELGAIDPGAEKGIELKVKPTAAGVISGAVNLTAGYCDPATANWMTSVEGVSALAIELLDAQDPIGVGSEQLYRIKVTNQGSGAATAIQVVCQLEDTMEFVSVEGQTKGKADKLTLTLEPVESLEAGASAEWTVAVKAIGAGDVRFKVIVTSAEIWPRRRSPAGTTPTCSWSS
ncbi:MAG: hypothetical protein ACYTGN_12955 [Planctomycetota bacterium]|jgi:uncharacterized repeat protein (TIGR01451 family)